MVKPAQFGFNLETAANNTFQNEDTFNFSSAKKAIEEFEVFINRLRSKKIDVTVIEDTAQPVKPDAVFPNNWISMHEDGRIFLYPMFAPNRRHERRAEIIEVLKEKYVVKDVIDLSHYEEKNIFLEGTGSIIFDHIHKKAYACISARTNKELFISHCKNTGYEPIYFFAYDRGGMEIYHTNVMMCLGDHFAVICMESITDVSENQKVRSSLENDGVEIIEISHAQLTLFAGNMLALKNSDGETILVLSKTAFDGLDEEQHKKLTQYAELLPMDIRTIETIGGGSARCMIAEIFLPPKK